MNEENQTNQENQNPINEVGKKNHYLLGILGALLGAFVGTIPWFLIYTFANLMVVWVAILIGIASYYGYKITKATIDKKMPAIITICSLIAIVVTTLVVIPICILIENDTPLKFENFKIIYEYSGFIHDFVISVLFTILGISGVVANLNRQIKDGVSRENLKINVSNSTIIQQVTPEENEIVKTIFSKNDAINKKGNKLTKEEILQDLGEEVNQDRAKQIFTMLKRQGIIAKSKGKYYFSEKNANHPYRRSIKIVLITIVITFLLIFAIALVAGLSNNSSSTSKNNTKNTTNIANISNVTNSTSNDDNSEEYEEEHVIEAAKMKYIPTDDMIILTKDEIDTYMGAGCSELYEIIAMNYTGTKMMYCFIIDNNNNQTAKEYLEKSLETLDYDEIKTEEISGFEFSTTKLNVEENEEQYTEACYVYSYDDKFLCFDYWYESSIDNEFSKMIEKVK